MQSSSKVDKIRTKALNNGYKTESIKKEKQGNYHRLYLREMKRNQVENN